MLLIDAHLDLAMNALQGNRDLTRSVYTIRTTEQKVSGKGKGYGTVAFPEMRKGRVALSFCDRDCAVDGTSHPEHRLRSSHAGQRDGAGSPGVLPGAGGVGDRARHHDWG